MTHSKVLLIALLVGCGGATKQTDCGLLDETACSTNTGCGPSYRCGTCGQTNFAECVDKALVGVPDACPQICVEPKVCSDHHDQASCAADPTCAAAGCPACDGSTSFISCYDKSSSPPPSICPQIACQPCSQLTESQCQTDSRCAEATCPTCNGGTSFVTCYDQSDSPLPIACAKECPAVCNGLSETDCKANSQCAVAGCAACDGSTTFDVCYDKDGSPPPIICPTLACAPACSGLDEADCKANDQCASVGCPACDGSTTFSACYNKGDSPPPIACPLLCEVQCSGLGQADCKANSQCAAITCPGCNDGPDTFVTCYYKSSPPPPVRACEVCSAPAPDPS